MSGPETSHEAPPGGPVATATPTGGDPSMEDILASIRRILSEDEAAPAPGAEPGHAPGSEPGAHDGSGILALDPAMIVSEPAAETAPPRPQAQTLVAPEAAEAAATALGNLVRTLAAERHMMVRSAGPSIEDIVREEIRPLLKAWLDAHLPEMVERLVRTEIERVVGRAVP
jgi:uncharacterized protein